MIFARSWFSSFSPMAALASFTAGAKGLSGSRFSGLAAAGLAAAVGCTTPSMAATSTVAGAVSAVVGSEHISGALLTAAALRAMAGACKLYEWPMTIVPIKTKARSMFVLSLLGDGGERVGRGFLNP